MSRSQSQQNGGTQSGPAGRSSGGGSLVARDRYIASNQGGTYVNRRFHSPSLPRIAMHFKPAAQPAPYAGGQIERYARRTVELPKQREFHDEDAYDWSDDDRVTGRCRCRPCARGGQRGKHGWKHRGQRERRRHIRRRQFDRCGRRIQQPADDGLRLGFLDHDAGLHGLYVRLRCDFGRPKHLWQQERHRRLGGRRPDEAVIRPSTAYGSFGHPCPRDAVA